jgi:hypothetical protein
MRHGPVQIWAIATCVQVEHESNHLINNEVHKWLIKTIRPAYGRQA